MLQTELGQTVVQMLEVVVQRMMKLGVWVMNS